MLPDELNRKGCEAHRGKETHCSYLSVFLLFVSVLSVPSVVQRPFFLTTEITEDTERRAQPGKLDLSSFCLPYISVVQIDNLLIPSLSSLQWKLISSPRLKRS